jgi:C-terminal processing protease CtpA/Prc
MKRNFFAVGMIAALVFGASGNLSGIDTSDTRMLSQPAASKTHVAFIYAEDLWVMNADGTDPRRLTVDEGIEGEPCFSPDGKLIAFSAQYDGNTDVFVIPVEGGVPVRLTWHPGADVARTFTPDGAKVVFASQRSTFTGRYAQLFTVGIEGGYPEQMQIPNSHYVSLSPDGKRMAYTPLPPAHAQWKNYRGGTVSTIWLFTQANRKAVIIDERFNGGGMIADYYIDLLQRPLQSYWNMRYGNDLKTPSASIQGPKVMIIDETAGSGGDMLPWMFRKFGVGTLVGKRTWGGLVGTLGFPELMDGGMVTAPNLAIWTEDGFVVENVGVAPDIEVEQWPADVLEGRDPQLEKAIEVALKELEKNPPAEPVRPPYPVKVRK